MVRLTMRWAVNNKSMIQLIIQASLFIYLSSAVDNVAVGCSSNLNCSIPVNSSCVGGSCSCLDGFQLTEDNSTCASIETATVDQDEGGLTKFAIVFIAVVFTVTSTILLTIICCIIYRKNKDHTNYSLALSSPSTDRDTEKQSDHQQHIELQAVPQRSSDMFDEEDEKDEAHEKADIQEEKADKEEEMVDRQEEKADKERENVDRDEEKADGEEENMDGYDRNEETLPHDETDGDIESLNHTISKEVKRDFFLNQIVNLRASATIFLAMFNEVKGLLDNAKHGNPRTDAFKDVVRDLSRVLFILNKKESDIKMAPDGIQLLQWAASSLKKYEDCHEIADRGEDWKGMSPEVTRTMWIESKDETVFKEAHSESALI